MRQIAIDKANEWLYVVDTTQGMTSKFALDGTYLTRWGGWGNTPGKFVAGGRGVTVDHDGNVWVGDMGGFRAQKFDSDGNFLLQVPEAPTSPPEGGFNQPRGVALGPDGDIFVTDTHNWRIERFNGDGSFDSAFGTRGSDDYKFNYPRGISIDQTDGAIVVADTDNHRIKRYADDGTFLWELGGYGKADGQFKTPHSVDVGSDGTIYVADSLNQRIVMLDRSGSVLGSFGAKGTGDGQHQFVRGVDYDESDGTIWLTDSVRGRVNHWTTDGTWLGAFSAVGTEDHQLLRAADIETDATYVYVADSDSDKIKIWLKDGTFVGAFTGGPGEAALQRPHGLDLVGDRLYVVEQTGERVQEFLITTGGEPDTTPPDATVAVPGSGTMHSSALPILFYGDATDDVAVASVRVAVKDKTSGLWWTGTSWGSFTYLSAELADPGTMATAWSLEWSPPSEGDYAILVEARDGSANPDPSKPWVPFGVYPGALDDTEPDATITVPAKGGNYPEAFLQLAGEAIDDASGVATVGVAIKNTQSGQWWTGSAWDPAVTFNDATLSNPGGTATSWTYDWTPPAVGTYGALVRTVDVAGNIDSTRSWHGFNVVTGGADVDPPDATITVPVKGSSQPFAPLTITGEATDADSGIAAVDVAIKNTATGEWWTGSGWGGFSYLPAVLDDPGSQSTSWATTWDPPGAGSYGILARATDVAGNIDPIKPWHGFTVE
jgi:sugar lactone lactonase YvrE